jgi:hypothetical protein
MEDQIINRVAQSALEVFDLEDYYPKGPKFQIDLAQWLDQGFLLREKPFREALQKHDWEQYRDADVALYCSTDAVVPAWASILVSVYLIPVAKAVVMGTLMDLDTLRYREILEKVDYSVYENKPVIIKGCSKMPVPESAYIIAATHLQGVAKSIMYGEACSAVPLYKRSKS